MSGSCISHGRVCVAIRECHCDFDGDDPSAVTTLGRKEDIETK